MKKQVQRCASTPAFSFAFTVELKWELFSQKGSNVLHPRINNAFVQYRKYAKLQIFIHIRFNLVCNNPLNAHFDSYVSTVLTVKRWLFIGRQTQNSQFHFAYLNWASFKVTPFPPALCWSMSPTLLHLNSYRVFLPLSFSLYPLNNWPSGLKKSVSC